jgi:hypothetical protein
VRQTRNAMKDASVESHPSKDEGWSRASAVTRSSDPYFAVNVTELEALLSKVSTATNAAVCVPGVRTVVIFS